MDIKTAPDLYTVFLKGSLALVFVLLLLLFLLLILRRIGPFKGSGARMKILEILALSSKEKLVLVSVYDKNLLLGLSSSGLNLLREFSPDSEEGLKDEDDKPSFLSFLNVKKTENLEEEKDREVEDEA